MLASPGDEIEANTWKLTQAHPTKATIPRYGSVPSELVALGNDPLKKKDRHDDLPIKQWLISSSLR